MALHHQPPHPLYRHCLCSPLVSLLWLHQDSLWLPVHRCSAGLNHYGDQQNHYHWHSQTLIAMIITLINIIALINIIGIYNFCLLYINFSNHCSVIYSSVLYSYWISQCSTIFLNRLLYFLYISQFTTVFIKSLLYFSIPTQHYEDMQK